MKHWLTPLWLAPALRTAADRRFPLSCGRIKIPINFIVGWAQTFTSQKQLTLLPILVTCVPRHQSKKMEDKAVATAAEEVPSDEKKADDEAAKAAEPKEDAPAPPAAGDGTAEASDKKEEDDAKAGTEEPPKDEAKMAGKDETTATEAKDDEKAKEVNCCLFYA